MHKQPISILLVVHTPTKILLLERADHAGYWQSITGSREGDEPLLHAAHRELTEETGLTVAVERLRDWNHYQDYDIFPEWRHRYGPNVLRNREHMFSLKLPSPLPVTLAPREHTQYRWVGWQEAAEQVFSPSNAAAIRMLATHSEVAP